MAAPEDRKYCPLWRVSINGAVFEVRTRSMEGALMSSLRNDTQNRMAAAGIHVGAHSMNGEARGEYDWSDAVITVERIGEPLEKRPAPAQPLTAHSVCVGADGVVISASTDEPLTFGYRIEWIEE